MDALTLRTPARTYVGGWKEFSIGRSLDRCVSDVSLTMTDPDGSASQYLMRFTPVTLLLGPDVVLTGYIDSYAPKISASGHSLMLTGRSKTEDLTDCELDIPSGQFEGYSLAAIARAVGAPFGIGVVVQTDGANVAVIDATLDRGEKAFDFIDRLATLAGVLASDDEAGNLVLTNAGDGRASGMLTLPGNILEASATLDSHDRFSDYIIKGQSGLGVAAGASGFDALDDDAGTDPDQGTVQTQQRAVAHDPSVPRYRPHVVIAQAQMTQAQMQVKANWEMQYAYGQSTKAEVTVQGYRQPDGSLWKLNQIVPVHIPLFGIDEDLLVLGVKYSLSGDGQRTVLTVGPVEGATPSPALLKRRRKRKGRGGGGYDWSAISGDAASDDAE